MPLGGKLKDDEIEDLVAWVKAGAVWPASAVTNAAKGDGKYVIAPERRNFWSLQPLSDPKPPAVKDARWAKTAIDRFVLARLEKEGLKPVKPASKHDLLRRATLDLDRPAAHSRRDRSVRKRHLARRLRQSGRPPARLAALRRALGPRLAGRRALRRRRLPQPEPQSARLPALSRTPSSIATGSFRPSTTTCRTTSSSRRSSPAICWTRRPAIRRCRPPASSASAPGITTTAPSKSPAPMNGMIAWMSSPAASSD